MLCPVTSKTKVNPFEVKLPDGYAVSGVVLSDQLSSLDWPSRQAMLIERVSSDVMAMVTTRVLGKASLKLTLLQFPRARARCIELARSQG